MARKSKSPKTTKAARQASTGAKKSGSGTTTRKSYFGKHAPKGGTLLSVAPQRRPLVEREEAPSPDPLVDFNSTNYNIIRQLRMITAYPFRLPDEMRDKVTAAVQEALADNMPIDIRLAAAGVTARLAAVNLATIKQLASDQVQRNLSFDKVDTAAEDRRRILQTLSDEELEQLESLADRMGGVIEIDAKVT